MIMSLGRAIKARPIAKHLLLASAQGAAKLASALGQPGKEVVHTVDILLHLTVLARPCPHFEIVQDCEFGKNPPALRHRRYTQSRRCGA